MNFGIPVLSHRAGHRTCSAVRIAPALLLVLLLIVSAGCLQADRTTGQPAAPPATDTQLQPGPESEVTAAAAVNEKSITATAQKPDETKIVITYHGGADSDMLMELETIVTDSKGTARIQTMGSRLGTTPVQNGATATIYGPFEEEARVIVTGYFSDGTHQDIIDTTL